MESAISATPIAMAGMSNRASQKLATHISRYPARIAKRRTTTRSRGAVSAKTTATSVSGQTQALVAAAPKRSGLSTMSTGNRIKSATDAATDHEASASSAAPRAVLHSLPPKMP